MAHKTKTDRTEYMRHWRLKNIVRLRAKEKENYWRDPEKAKRRALGWYQKNKKRSNETHKRWRANNREKWDAYFKPYILNHRLVKTYGITTQQRDKLFAQNNGLCWICSKRAATHVDHNHDTREVRGTLCNQCNIGIGCLNDDLEIVLKAAQYLKSKRPVIQ